MQEEAMAKAANTVPRVNNILFKIIYFYSI